MLCVLYCHFNATRMHCITWHCIIGAPWCWCRVIPRECDNAADQLLRHTRGPMQGPRPPGGPRLGQRGLSGMGMTRALSAAGKWRAESAAAGPQLELPAARDSTASVASYRPRPTTPDDGMKRARRLQSSSCGPRG